jgi:hypothetical protein
MSDSFLYPDMFVLDSLANDVESVDDILRMLNSETVLGWTSEWGRSFTEEDVHRALTRLIKRELVRAFAVAGDSPTLEELPLQEQPPEGLNEGYFGLTESGRRFHREWASLQATEKDRG